jgi:hypothetical protein
MSPQCPNKHDKFFQLIVEPYQGRQEYNVRLG